MDLIIATYNVAGLDNGIKRKSISNFLRRTNLTLLFFKKLIYFLKMRIIGNGMERQNYLWSHCTTNSKGVAIAFKRN